MTDSPLLERAARFVSALRHCQVLGIEVHAANAEGMTLRLPYSPQIVGDPQTGIIHGGALTSAFPPAVTCCCRAAAARAATMRAVTTASGSIPLRPTPPSA